MNSLPEASTLRLLSSLPKLRVGDKVRFLGCITGYAIETATLTIEHDYPKSNNIRVSADIKLLVENLKLSAVDIGTWTNVVGYITWIKKPNARRSYTSVGVHALMIWQAGPFCLGTYEKLVGGSDLSGLDN